jgi:hypothetical protein
MNGCQKSLLIVTVWLFLLAGPVRVSNVHAIEFQVSSKALMTDVSRFGVNLGFWTSWGAEQLMANVIKNPGFEGLIDRTIIVVGGIEGNSFWVDDAHLGWPDGFWAGAQYHIRTGRGAGQTGLIDFSLNKGGRELPEYSTRDNLAHVAIGDVIVLTRIRDSALPTQWWIAETVHDFVGVDTTQPRPGSPGIRSLVLRSSGSGHAEIFSYLDAIGDRAGKLLPVRGKWQLSFWARSSEGKAKLAVRFRRQGTVPFLERTVSPSSEWKHYIFEFDARDSGPPGMLELSFRTRGESGRVLLDDVDLRSTGDDSQPFRKEVVRALKKLRPGYLRDWQDQLGDTLDNRLSEVFGRRASRYRPGGVTETKFHYSLEEFLTLCREVGAVPWVVLPTTFSDQELHELGQYLASRIQSDHFKEILVEFGNENWNAIFRPAGIPDPEIHGKVAKRAFQLIRMGAGLETPIRTLVNGQHANPPYALQFLDKTPGADLLAVAPYFLYSLVSGLDRQEQLRALLEDDGGRLQQLSDGVSRQREGLAVSEVNLHTLGGDAGPGIRGHVVAGMGAGTALAKRLLQGLALGVQPQCVWLLSGFDAKLSDQEGFVPLWGIVRDLGSTQRLRPTGLVLSMLNHAVQGDVYQVSERRPSASSHVHVTVFASSSGWSVVAVSEAAEPMHLSIQFPPGLALPLPKSFFVLDGKSPEETNEFKEEVRIVRKQVHAQAHKLSFDLPAWGVGVMLTNTGAL